METIFELVNAYELKDDDVKNAEERMNIIFPKDLKKLFSKIGYGFVINSKGAINRLIDPDSCADIRLREDIYEFDPDLELYLSFEDDKLIFFEVNEGVYISIGINDNKIYYLDRVIAENIEEFICKISKNPDYWCE